MKKALFARLATFAAVAGSSVCAFASADPVADMFAGISLTSVAAAVAAMGLLIVGIAMAYKAIDLAKRGVKKV